MVRLTMVDGIYFKLILDIYIIIKKYYAKNAPFKVVVNLPCFPELRLRNDGRLFIAYIPHLLLIY